MYDFIGREEGARRNSGQEAEEGKKRRRGSIRGKDYSAQYNCFFIPNNIMLYLATYYILILPRQMLNIGTFNHWLWPCFHSQRHVRLPGKVVPPRSTGCGHQPALCKCSRQVLSAKKTDSCLVWTHQGQYKWSMCGFCFDKQHCICLC